MHGINGYLYGNLKGLDMKNPDKVRWYLLSMGGEHDRHSATFVGNTVVKNGMRKAVIPLLPASTIEVDMQPNKGTWAI